MSKHTKMFTQERSQSGGVFVSTRCESANYLGLKDLPKDCSHPNVLTKVERAK